MPRVCHNEPQGRYRFRWSGPTNNLFQPLGRTDTQKNPQPRNQRWKGVLLASLDPRHGTVEGSQRPTDEDELRIPQVGPPADHRKPRRALKPTVDPVKKLCFQDKVIIAKPSSLSRRVADGIVGHHDDLLRTAGRHWLPPFPGRLHRLSDPLGGFLAAATSPFVRRVPEESAVATIPRIGSEAVTPFRSGDKCLLLRGSGQRAPPCFQV